MCLSRAIGGLVLGHGGCSLAPQRRQSVILPRHFTVQPTSRKPASQPISRQKSASQEALVAFTVILQRKRSRKARLLLNTGAMFSIFLGKRDCTIEAFALVFCYGLTHSPFNLKNPMRQGFRLMKVSEGSRNGWKSNCEENISLAADVSFPSIPNWLADKPSTLEKNPLAEDTPIQGLPNRTDEEEAPYDIPPYEVLSHTVLVKNMKTLTVERPVLIHESYII
ncbi:3-methyl-2-oxobutanoate hydroxymethyltransferase [Striga asiatica]|uniref:3-methyl-2-oxobutanoate hydroxymethyltransferase n=1 Tax=Striga asiatica TaxID=4170 RepID=A0A5A7R2D9_STRAF|nr:3-methyl-2-oxobutanoate hydroxymethyltransferase [Striga asiatica]